MRRGGFPRAAAIASLPSGKTFVKDNVLPPYWAAIGSGLASLAIIAGYLLWLVRMSPLLDDSIWTSIVALFAIAGALLGWFLAHRLRLGVRRSILERYRRWVTAGETLVVVEVEVEQARTALALLRGTEEARPAPFIVRPHRALFGRVGELQRRERFSPERLKLYASSLAAQHAGALRRRRPQPLWDRLHSCEREINAITVDLAQAVQLEQSISVSAEWLLDNAYVIQRQIADARQNLSHQLYNALPTLEAGTRRGEPRTYDLAAEMVAHTDAELTEQDIVDFLLAYQRVSPLSMGELWALPLLLRLALVESLSYLAGRIDEQQHEFEWADFWANRLLVAARRAPDHDR